MGEAVLCIQNSGEGYKDIKNTKFEAVCYPYVISSKVAANDIWVPNSSDKPLKWPLPEPPFLVC